MDFFSATQLGHLIFALTVIPAVLVGLALVVLWVRAIRRALAQPPAAPQPARARMLSRVSLGMVALVLVVAVYAFGLNVLNALAAPLP